MMLKDVPEEHPVLGQGVLYLVQRVIPNSLFMGRITKVSLKRITVHVPHFSQKVNELWDPYDPKNYLIFTKRASGIYGELDDGYGLDCILFLDLKEQRKLEESFEDLWPPKGK